ncbi:MAG: exopolysaccharide biosynthesis polyprenyl glycosylphosphotransferase [Opitutaceae bacterium]|nr:exopolysaccharide biosynthesis polyprenyl glycosylphosphotransferase [Opitutaceae bacterium]
MLVLLLAGDFAVCYVGLTAAYWLRFKTPLRTVGILPSGNSFELYQPLIWTGVLLFVATYAYLKLYDARILLRPQRVQAIVTKGTAFWFGLFLLISLALKFEPAVSRIFVALACLTTLAAMLVWRWGFFAGLSRTNWRERVLQRVVYVGWTPEARKLAAAIHADRNHPYESFGIISTPTQTDAPITMPARAPDATAISQPAPTGLPLLGPIEQAEAILADERVDLVIVADLALSQEHLMRLSALCERRYIAIKLIPALFQIFVSNLRMQTISGVPILGVENLPLRRLINQLLKRATDIVGALVGLLCSLPIMGVLALIIKRQSPGSVIYRQTRAGRNGEPFTIYKLRSMKLNAEAQGAQWAVEADPRRLPIGAFMREWNLDELPQFWNVLKGDMSLVGPRPERPELIEKFEQEIPHYNPRHEVRPGLTGWAQVNGLRGNTSLVERIRYDLFYIENWSLWFDFQIMLLTFVKRQNAY